ncbi:MAG: NDMA-dependent alcohol dehydrogenase [Ilumatobacteraceae bacterium]|jgi:NDMA-dependent alcohol dehydrogenase|nr:NDMA-dependent alcohol dehydrogenase [Ilumatobacteraceae bacterium]
MKSKAAMIHGLNQEWSVEEIDIQAPKKNEVIVHWRAAGMCHSDEHLVTGDMVPPQEYWEFMGLKDFFPMIGGHEGAGVVVEVGPDVTDLAVGDHVSASFVPSCGRCRYCSTGRQNLCDLGSQTFIGGMITDGTHRHFQKNGEPVTLMAKLGTFSEYACVATNSLIKIDKDIPLEAAALVSCGVATGWGSATARAQTKPGDTVVVVGVGGIGMNAVQGAKMAGAKRIIAIDPVEFKREKAMEFGATHTFSSMAEALPAVMEMTWGQLADRVIMTPGVLHGEMMGEGMSLAGKGSTVVVTAISPMTSTTASINLFELAMWQKEVKGTIFGSLNPRADIPALLDMYRSGTLKLDELITKRYPLDQINEGYRAMRDGENIRGVIVNG